MYPRDFVYWLKGFFELALAARFIKTLKYPSDEIEPLLFEFDSCFDEDKFRETIVKTCNIVLITKSNSKIDYLDFVKWVKTALEFDASLYAIYKKLNEFTTQTLNESFKHQT